MFKIIKAGETLAMTEAPNFIKRQENGCFCLCSEDEAVGIAFDGTPYRLLGVNTLDELETVMAVRMDGGAEITQAKWAVSDSDAMNVDQEYRLTLLELGISDSMGQ